jgi:hypothetical protein
MTSALIEIVDRTRLARGFLSVGETLALEARGNTILDPFSTLVARDVRIGRDNLFEPNVQLLCHASARLVIGDGNAFHPGTRIEAAAGLVHIGHRNVFGPGGFSAVTLSPDAEITIGDNGRYTLNCAVSGQSGLGSGSQILGPIAVDSCTLGAGGAHDEPDADLRGAVLKGSGRARGLVLRQGQVIQSFGQFDMADVSWQSFFHPPKGLRA